MIEIRTALIHAAVAKAIIPLRRPLKPDDRFDVIKTLEDAERAKGYTEEGDEHNCPLCHEYFTYRDLVAHAQQCIRARAPRWEVNRDREPVRLTVHKQFRPKLSGPNPRGDVRR